MIKDFIGALFPLASIIIWVIMCIFLAGCEHLGATKGDCYLATTVLLAVSIAAHIIRD